MSESDLNECVQQPVADSRVKWPCARQWFAVPSRKAYPYEQTSDATHTAILPENGASLDTLVETYEREILVDALKKHRGNAAAAARFLQTTARIMNYRIRHLGIDPKSYK